MRIRIALCAALAAVLSTPAGAVVPTLEKPAVIILVLDKMTARVEEMELPVGKALEFGTLSITARSCKTTLPEESPPESAAFLEVSEVKIGAVEGGVFKGWMFASSPALSAMEHPVYDIWVTGCKD